MRGQNPTTKQSLRAGASQSGAAAQLENISDLLGWVVWTETDFCRWVGTTLSGWITRVLIRKHTQRHFSNRLQAAAKAAC